MSFSAEWLALREPCDHASVNPEVRAALASRFAGATSVRIVDLGCGAGSNLRGTFAALPAQQHWSLVDYDPKLLAAARARLASWADRAEAAGEDLALEKDGKRLTVRFREADLSAGEFGSAIDGADLVSAAALFDLVSVPVIERLVEAVVSRRQTFYTVLTYDGFTRWTPAHPMDDAIRAAFNSHQKTDKGFGLAAGPGATTALAKAFYARGWRFLRGSSPWIADNRHSALRDALDEGFVGAAVDAGGLTHQAADEWLAARRATRDAVSAIGHEDLLALPD
jgi:SAM-dependent methyltransferase